MSEPLNLLPIQDILALIWMLVCWVGYAVVTDRIALDKREVARVMYYHRVTWMERMLERENRMPDINIITAHIRSGILFASTTILILAGSVAVLGNLDRLRIVISELSFAAEPLPEMLELKVFVLIGIFVYAFFKYAWCLRQYNNSLILIGAAPQASDCDGVLRADYSVRAASVLTRAANTFNLGLRSYYFGLASLTWFIQPWLLALSALWVILVLYRRDYRSQTLEALSPLNDSRISP